MKPKYSEEDRYKIVMNFIAQRGQGQIPIHDFSPLLKYITDFTPLRDIKKTSFKETYADGSPVESKGIVDFSGHVSNPLLKIKTSCHSEDDVEEYFNWLIWMLTADDKATDETRKEAVSQLLLFIFALRDVIPVSLDDFLRAGFQWEARMNIIDENFASLKSDLQYLEKRNDSDHFDYNEDHKAIEGLKANSEKITLILERIRNWQKENQPYLNKIKKDQENIDKALKGELSGK